MAGAYDLFDPLNSPLSVDGGRKLALDREACAWAVSEGTVHVFASRVDEAGSEGRLHYISQFDRGDMLFGAKPCTDGGKTVVFLCAGNTDTRLVKVDPADMQRALKDEAKAGIIRACVKRWVRVLEESPLGPAGDTGWADDPDLAADGLPELLESFNREALKRAALYIGELYREEEQRLLHRHTSDDFFIKASLKKLTEASRQGRKKRKAAADSMEPVDDLLAACRIVGRELDMELKLPPEAVLKGSKDVLSDIARYSRIRCRQVFLPEKWWKTDNGPLVASLGEDGAPVALLPAAGGKYKMVNPRDGSERIVDRETALKINPKAHMFYRVLPGREVKAADLARFCWHGSVKKDLPLVAFIGMLGGILNMFVPIANGILFDSIIPDGERGQLLQMALILGSLGVSAVLFQLVRTLAMLRVEGRIDTLTQAAVWDRVLSLPVSFFRQFTAGELAMRAMGVKKIRKALSGPVITTLLSAIFSVFNLGLLFVYSSKMAVYALALILVPVAVTFACSLLQLRYERELTDASNKIVGQVLQIIGGIGRFRVAGAEKRAFFQWAKAFGRQKEIETKNKTLKNVLTTFNEIFPILSSMVIFYVAFSSNAVGAGGFIAFNSAFSAFMAAMLALSGMIPALNSIVPTFESIKPILGALPEYDEVKEDPGELDGSIELSHITFRYKPDAPAVLNDLSLKVNKGEYLAIVGPSGCGKSTILRLLLGFEKPESGKIYYGVNDMEKVDIRAIRRQLGVVMQTSQLMAGDIKSNIIGANLNLTTEDAKEAAEMAGIYEDIQAMPMGMFTVISEGGSTLSGGQRQRLMIARAIAGRPKIIFFDEATSALDNRTQATVSRSMDSLKATRIVIAHRLSTIMKCDRILVIDKGRIVEQGSYEELMKNGSMFYELARRQLA